MLFTPGAFLFVEFTGTSFFFASARQLTFHYLTAMRTPFPLVPPVAMERLTQAGLFLGLDRFLLEVFEVLNATGRVVVHATHRRSGHMSSYHTSLVDVGVHHRGIGGGITAKISLRRFLLSLLRFFLSFDSRLVLLLFFRELNCAHNTCGSLSLQNVRRGLRPINRRSHRHSRFRLRWSNWHAIIVWLHATSSFLPLVLAFDDLLI